MFESFIMTQSKSESCATCLVPLFTSPPEQRHRIGTMFAWSSSRSYQTNLLMTTIILIDLQTNRNWSLYHRYFICGSCGRRCWRIKKLACAPEAVGARWISCEQKAANKKRWFYELSEQVVVFQLSWTKVEDLIPCKSSNHVVEPMQCQLCSMTHTFNIDLSKCSCSSFRVFYPGLYARLSAKRLMGHVRTAE